MRRGNAGADGGTDVVVAPSKLHLETESGGFAAIAPGRRVAAGWASSGRWPTLSRTAWRLNGIALGSLLIVSSGFLHRAAGYAPGLRAAIETLIASCALVAAWTFRVQFVRSRRLRDLLVFGSLLMLALVELFSFWLPAILDVKTGATFAAAAMWGRVFTAAALATAAFVPSNDPFLGTRRPVAAVAGLAVATAVLADLLGLLFRRQLVFPGTTPMFGVADAVTHPLALGLALCTTVLFVYAAIGFARAAEGERDSVTVLLAAACLLQAASALYFLPLPRLPPGWIAPRESLRLLGVALILAAGVCRELRTRAGIARAAAVAERRRVARDLHDGIAQDLALIVAHGSRIAAELGGEHPVTAAAARALAVSRGTISDLSDPAGATTLDALEAVAHEVRSRFGIAVIVDAERDADPAPHVREHLTRIAREAIANAARHGGAEHVTVSLTRAGSGVALRVRDDGCGIDNAGSSGRSEGFGLRSMRERALAMGGELTIHQTRPRGTELEVVLP